MAKQRFAVGRRAANDRHREESELVRQHRVALRNQSVIIAALLRRLGTDATVITVAEMEPIPSNVRVEVTNALNGIRITVK